MSIINIFLQGEGIKDIVLLQLEPQSTTLDVKRACISNGIQVGNDATIFLEDQDEPLDDAVTVESLTNKHGVRLHIHRCKHVSFKVAYSGRTVGNVCGPSKTIGTLKDWAAKELGIPKEDAVELILQITGAHEQPDVDVHIGALATCPSCEIEFDLVPNPRIQGTA